jgi:peroxiredoxin
MRIRITGMGGLALFLSAALAAAVVPAAYGAAEGEPLPKIELADVRSGGMTQLTETLAGSVGAVIFMQTSCAACRKELIAFKEISGRHPDLKVAVISVDTGPASRVDRYRDSNDFPFPFYHDPDFKTPGLFNFAFTPALVLVDKAGMIALLKGGFRPGEEVELEKKIEKLKAGL